MREISSCNLLKTTLELMQEAQVISEILTSNLEQTLKDIKTIKMDKF